MTSSEKKQLQMEACKVRMGVIESTHGAKAGHPGGSLSAADVFTYLYFKEMNIDPSLDPSFTLRVEQYCQLLRQKKQTLLSIFDCCDDFYMQMRRELDALNSRFSTDSKARATFVCNYSNKCASKPFVPNETNLLMKKQRRNRLPSAALEILWNFLREHRDNPYPTSQEKEWLAQQTNLSVTQIRNWFTNTRKRKLIQSQESDEEYLTDSDFSDSFHDSQTSSDSQPHKRRGRKKSSSTRSQGPLEMVQHQSTITMNDGTLSKVTKNQDGTWIQFLSAFDHNSNLNHSSDVDSEGAHQQQQEFSLPDFDNYTESNFSYDYSRTNLNNPEQHEYIINNEVATHVKRQQQQLSQQQQQLSQQQLQLNQQLNQQQQQQENRQPSDSQM